MARRARLTRTRLASGLAVMAAGGALLAMTLLWRGQRNPILGQIPTGSVMGAVFSGTPPRVDGRAFIIDDGAIDRVVTMQGNGYSWSGVLTNPVLRQIDTATGRLLGSVTLNAGAGGAAYVLDPATQRVFAIDPNGQQITVLDARQGAVLATPAWPTDRTGAPLSMTNVNASVIDPRSGHIFLFMALGSSVAAGQPRDDARRA